MQAVIVVAAKFLIYCAVLDEVPGNDQHPMRDRERRLLTTAFYGYTPKQRGQVAVLFTHHRPGALRQNSSQIPVSFARRTGVSFACTFVIAWRQPNPTRQVTRIGKPAHIQSDL